MALEEQVAELERREGVLLGALADERWAEVRAFLALKFSHWESAKHMVLMGLQKTVTTEGWKNVVRSCTNGRSPASGTATHTNVVFTYCVRGVGTGVVPCRLLLLLLVRWSA